MFTNAILIKISLALAAILALLGLWYAEYHSNAAKEATFIDRIEKAQKAHQPTKAQLEEAAKFWRTNADDYEHFVHHGLEGLHTLNETGAQKQGKKQ
jgi:hypothetical protein